MFCRYAHTVSPDLLRAAVREEQKLNITYVDASGIHSQRVVWPFALVYFIGGFSDLPSLTLYDFRKSPPVALPISDKLDLENVRWTDSSVLLSADGKWYSFSRNRLSRLKAPERIVQ